MRGIRSESDRLLVQAYFQEYQAAQNRIIRFMVLQYSIWPVSIATLSFFVKSFSSDTDGIPRFGVIWGCIIAILLVIHFYLFALHEVYNQVRYIENVLRPKVSRLLRTDSFWGWERYLERTGRANPPAWGDYVPLAAAICAPLLLHWDIWGWPYINTALLIFYYAVFYFLPYKTAQRLVSLRESFNRKSVLTTSSDKPD